MSLKVLKGFRHEGRDYRPGEEMPLGLNARTKELLIRTRHLHDPKVRTAPKEVNELKVTKNPDFPPESVVLVGLSCPTCFRMTGRSRALDNGRCHTCGYDVHQTPVVPAGSVGHLAGRELAQAQDWNAGQRIEGTAASAPGVVLLDKAPADALAGRKLAAQQDWGEKG